MRISILGFILLLLSQTVFSVAKIQQWKTSQGVPVYYVETKGLPMVDIQIVFDAGSARDGDLHGVASLTSSLLDAGAGSWNADLIAQRFESTGAQFSSSVSKDMVRLSLRSLTEEVLFNKGLDTLKAIVTQPSFNLDDFQRNKKRTLAGLKHREESPGEIAELEFYKTLYQNHPYAHSESGDLETVKKLSLDDLKGFYKQYYVASNAIVIIVGDLSRPLAENTAEWVTRGLEKGQKPTAIPQIGLAQKGIKKHIEFPSSQTHVLAGLVGMHRKDRDYFSLYVGNHILGGGGLVSQLFEEVREKRGLAYSAYSYFSPQFREGPFVMGLQTRNDQTLEAVSVMQKTLKKFVDEGPSEKALIAAKKNLTGGFAIRFDTNKKLTKYVAMIGFYQLPLDYLDQFQKKVEAVSVESIKEAFQRRVQPNFVHTITVGNSSYK